MLQRDQRDRGPSSKLSSNHRIHCRKHSEGSLPNSTKLRKPSAAVISHRQWWCGPGSAPPGRRRWFSSIESSKSMPPAISNRSSATYWSRGRWSTLAQKDSCFYRTGTRRIQPIRCFQAFGVKTFCRRIRRISTQWTTPSGISWSKKSWEHDTLPSTRSKRLWRAPWMRLRWKRVRASSEIFASDWENVFKPKVAILSTCYNFCYC